MKNKTLLLSVTAILTTSVNAQTVVTPHIGLQIPAANSTAWQTLINYDLQQIDKYLSGQLPIPALSVTGNTNLMGTFSASNLTFTPQQIQSGLGFVPVKPSNNLGDLTDKNAALTNLGTVPQTYIDAADSTNAQAAQNANAAAGTASANAMTALSIAQTAQSKANSAVQPDSSVRFSAITLTGLTPSSCLGTDGNNKVATVPCSSGSVTLPKSASYIGSDQNGQPIAVAAPIAHAAGTGAGVVQVNDGNGNISADPIAKLVNGKMSLARAVQQLPRVDVTYGPAPADPTGNTDSTVAIQAAINFSLSQGNSDFGGNAGIHYPVYIPCGLYKINGTIRVPDTVSVIADGKSCATLWQTNPTAPLMTLGTGPQFVSQGTAETVISGLNFKGSGHLTTGALLEIDTTGHALNDLNFYNNGGRGINVTNAERITMNNIQSSFVRWPFVSSGDTNESYAYNLHFNYGGMTDEPAPAGSPNSQWCYGVNCKAGVLVAGNASSATPTPVYSDPYGSIYVEKAVNFHIANATLKTNFWQSAVRFNAADVTSLHGIYTECAGNNPLPCDVHSVIQGGSGIQTYLTAPPVVESANSSLYAAPVNDTSWMPLLFGLESDAVSYFTGNYNPYVIIPQDYDPASSSPSAYATGLNKNQYETINAAGFSGDTGKAVFARNANGVYNATTNVLGVPANYVWPAGSIIEDIAQTGAQNGINIDTNHFNIDKGSLLAGNSTTGYWKYTNSGQFPGGEVVIGIPADTVNLNSNPALNQNGWFRPRGAVGDFAQTKFTAIFKDDEFSSDSNTAAAGEINVLSPANIKIDGQVLDPNIANMPLTATSATGTKTLSLATVTVGGGMLVANADSLGNPMQIRVHINNIDAQFDAATGTYYQGNASYFANGALHEGLQFQGCYSIFDTPYPNTANPAAVVQPTMEQIFCSNKDGNGFVQILNRALNQVWETVSSSGLAVQVPIQPNAGIQQPTVFYPANNATVNLTQGTHTAIGGNGVTVVLPTSPSTQTAAGFEYDVIRIDSTPFTVSAPGNTIYVNNTSYGHTFTSPGGPTKLQFVTDPFGNYVTTGYVPELAPVGTVTTGAGFGGAVTVTTSGPATVQSGQLSFTTTAAGTAGGVGITFFYPTPIAVPFKKCTLSPQNAAAASVPMYSSQPTSAGVTFIPTVAAAAGGPNLYAWDCSK